MNRLATPATIVEEMGLRPERTTRLRLLDGILVVALVASGAAWVWVSLVGVEPNLVSMLASPAGRVIAAIVGGASVLAVVRVFIVLGWPITDADHGLL